jgi:hypothetical protein
MINQALVLCNIIEWILGIPLTPVASESIARHYNAAVMWANQGYPNELMGINQLIAETQQMQYAQPYIIENFRQTRRQQIIMTYQQLANSYNVWPEIQYEARVILSLLQQQQQNAFSPALSQEIIDSCVDMLAFMIAEVKGQDPSTITTEAKENVRNMFIMQLQNMAPQQVQQFNLIPQMWQQMQALWPNTSEAEKQQARYIWATQLGISIGQPNHTQTAGNIPVEQGTNVDNRQSMLIGTSVKGDKNVTGTDNVIGNSNTIINFLNADEKMLESVLKKIGKNQ